jgi:hypothetical protein
LIGRENGSASSQNRKVRLAMSGILDGVPLDGILRIDAALEGNWSGTVVTVWRRGQIEPDFSQVVLEHPEYHPSLELYFEGRWVGVHCFRREGDQNRFDQEKARALVNEIIDRLQEPDERLGSQPR